RDTIVMVNNLADKLCGISRGRGHFIGVCTVVTKLFNIVQPTTAYFGQKDAQQALIIQRMTEDLNMPIEIEVCPIVREKDGLAMSSRNVRIPEHLRPNALTLYKALCHGRKMLQDGETDANLINHTMSEMIIAEKGVELDYMHISSLMTLEDVDRIERPVIFAGAIKVGDVRLIDNILVGPDGPWED
ncbi:MAG: pantoate--beta-alanine ligase, partial [Planctomycetes bacterium]|nr:pantoate--beta-alanine ligase [Planctomycetota bacterium]